MNRQFTEAPAKIHQIFGRDLLVAENDQLIFDESLIDGSKCYVRKLMTKVDATDLGTQIDPYTGYGDASALRRDGPMLPGVDVSVHVVVLPVTASSIALTVRRRARVTQFPCAGRLTQRI